MVAGRYRLLAPLGSGGMGTVWRAEPHRPGEGLHAINRVFVVDGLGHSLFFQTPRSDVAEARADFDGIVAACRPVGG